MQQNYSKLVISLDGVERSALAILAERERRDLHMQAAWLIRRGLEREGLLSAELMPNAPARTVEVERERAG